MILAHLLREQLDEATVDRVDKHLNRIRNGSLKMSALIDDGKQLVRQPESIVSCAARRSTSRLPRSRNSRRNDR